jgi:hypothetical protein
MTTSEKDVSEEYQRYADYCLNLARQLTDQEARRIQREMAAEWLRLAGAIQKSGKSKRRKMG